MRYKEYPQFCWCPSNFGWSSFFFSGVCGILLEIHTSKGKLQAAYLPKKFLGKCVCFNGQIWCVISQPENGMGGERIPLIGGFGHKRQYRSLGERKFCWESCQFQRANPRCTASTAKCSWWEGKFWLEYQRVLQVQSTGRSAQNPWCREWYRKISSKWSFKS